MKNRLFFTIVLLGLAVVAAMAKGFQPPSKGKAVVYFTRVSSWGAGTSFEFFDGNKFIGVFKGKNYMRYECDPGEHLFWASSENKEFMTADLKAGGTYIVVVDVITGMWKNHVGLHPISMKDDELLQRAIELVNKKDPVVTPEKKIQSTTKKLKDFIPEMLQRYENEWKDTKNFRHLSADMAIPENRLT